MANNNIDPNFGVSIDTDYVPRYNYTQFSEDRNINVIPEDDFKRLVADTFSTMTSILRSTYGPYGNVILISDQNETTTTKDGYNVCEAIGFSHPYKKLVYLAIKKICDRVNRNVGDGTTSCILLAEKIFHSLNETIKTPDDKRVALSILSEIETYLQNPDNIENDLNDNDKNYVSPLTFDAFKNVIKMASNNDENLANILVDAFSPEYDADTGIISSIRNVIPDSTIDRSVGSDTSYKISYMPGDYRVRVNINPEVGLMLQAKTTMKVVIYDHVFSSTDWDNFMADYDKETETIIIATGFNPLFKDNDYVRYCAQRAFVKAPTTVFLCAMQGVFVQDEIADLCAILKTESRKLTDISHVDHNNNPKVSLSVYKGNAMCFYDVDVPEDYVNTITYDMNNDSTKSIIRKQNYQDRINALTMNNRDTLIDVRASSSLELKMIMDKIDDCTSIITSAFKYGIVPNMLKYAYIRLCTLFDIVNCHNTDEMMHKIHVSIVDKIRAAIIELYKDIWYSKYTISIDETSIKMRDSIGNKFYTDSDYYDKSYNIISNKFVDFTNLPTSAQYDMEVTAAAISIVKYLITSRALVYDVFLQKPANDISAIDKL